MAGLAAINRMDLAGPDKGRGSGIGMTAHAIIRYCGGAGDIGIDLDRDAVAMSVAGEVGAMTLDAGATLAEVDSGVAMAVDTNSAGAVNRIMA